MYQLAEDPRLSEPHNEAARKIKAELIRSFDAMLDEPPSDNLNALWQQALSLERALRMAEQQKVETLSDKSGEA